MMSDEWSNLTTEDDEWSHLTVAIAVPKTRKKTASMVDAEDRAQRNLKVHRALDEWDITTPEIDHNWTVTGLVMGMATQRCLCCGHDENFSIGVFLRQQHRSGAMRHDRLVGQVPIEFTDLPREIDTLCSSDIVECPRCFDLEPTPQLPLFDAEVPVTSTLMYRLADILLHT